MPSASADDRRFFLIQLADRRTSQKVQPSNTTGPLNFTVGVGMIKARYQAEGMRTEA